MSNPPHTPPLKPHKYANIMGPLGATPTRAGDNFVSSTKLGHTQQEIKSSLWGRILRNEPGFIKHLIKPHLVDDTLVTTIEQAIRENAELKAARDLLFQNAVPENEMYTPMVSACVDYCWESSSERTAGHTTSLYLYLQHSAWGRRTFVGQRTDSGSGSGSNHWPNSACTHYSQSTTRCFWGFLLCSIAHYVRATAHSD